MNATPLLTDPMVIFQSPRGVLAQLDTPARETVRVDAAGHLLSGTGEARNRPDTEIAMRAVRYVILIAAAACTMDQPAETAVEIPTPLYPENRRDALADTLFGVPVADSYRWLEADVRESEEVRNWVTAQNEVTDAYLAALPARADFAARLTELIDYERFGVPDREGGRYFHTHNSGLQNQAVLYLRETLDGPGRLLIDPNTWSEDGATALAEWAPSEDGTKVLYSVQEGGTDWRILRVLDVATGAPLPDEVRWVKFSLVEWAADGSGFFYSRFPEPEVGQQFQSLNENHTVHFHRLGTPQSEDRLIWATPQSPRLNHLAQVSDDSRRLVITSIEGTDERYDITVVDLIDPGAAPRRLVTGLEHRWDYVGNVGERYYWVTDRDAPRLRVVSTDLSRPGLNIEEIVPEVEHTVQQASVVGERLVVVYMQDARSDVRTYTLDGDPVGSVALPGIGTAGGFARDSGESDTFFAFTSYNRPTTIYRWDGATNESSVWAQPEVAFSPDDFVVEQRFYASKDGTRVPLFVVHRRDVELTGGNATLLYGYGGFNIPLTPGFSAINLAWVDAGGVYAVANLRGGGEYGKAWHDAGRLQNKQNVFDDFIAAGEYLIAEGIAAPGRLAIHGGSNGGLLVGAVVNQRPDLFAAAAPAVGVMDMLRFDRFTAGRYWVDDYGYPDREADFRTLLAYSPYHNIRDDVTYPPVLVTTADTDDRVVPGHSFKYVAALQHADPRGAPHLIRIETRAGHGSGKPTDKIIDEYADVWAFLAHHTGLVSEAPGR
jgi:prolyl oligopeptidase